AVARIGIAGRADAMEHAALRETVAFMRADTDQHGGLALRDAARPDLGHAAAAIIGCAIGVLMHELLARAAIGAAASAADRAVGEDEWAAKFRRFLNAVAFG